ncbi:MAG: SEC-C domain-containing protein [Bryobacteraceae bacterium]|nr:SEC-C domain-containing protein [Bryobacteraceae bacterium]
MSPAIHQNSSLSSPPPISSLDGLTPVQAQVAAALAEGKTVSAAARDAGLHRTTVHHWLRTLPEFTRSVEQARADYKNQLADELTELASAALATLRGLLEDSQTPPAVRLKTALAILHRPRFPDRDWNLPAPVESPARQRYADEMALLAADYKMMRMSDALDKAGATPTAAATVPAASAPHAPTPPAPTPRNAPCPCGSGLKYKRCCGRTAPPASPQ